MENQISPVACEFIFYATDKNGIRNLQSTVSYYDNWADFSGHKKQASPHIVEIEPVEIRGLYYMRIEE